MSAGRAAHTRIRRHSRRIPCFLRDELYLTGEKPTGERCDQQTGGHSGVEEELVNEGSIELDRRPGRIEVSPSAIAMAASRVVLECYGVVGIANSKLKHGKAVLLDDGNYQRGIVVSVKGDGVVVDVYVVIEYGTRISEVAHNVMNAVRDALQRMLGSGSIRVNVNVQGLRISG